MAVELWVSLLNFDLKKSLKWFIYLLVLFFSQIFKQILILNISFRKYIVTKNYQIDKARKVLAKQVPFPMCILFILESRNFTSNWNFLFVSKQIKSRVYLSPSGSENSYQDTTTSCPPTLALHSPSPLTCNFCVCPPGFGDWECSCHSPPI